MKNHKICIGTRGSELALVQTDIIQNQLKTFFPNFQISVKIIKTTGDTNTKMVPLDSVGKGWFTKELDDALIAGNIDIAVHSLKDVPEDLPNTLRIAAISEREDPRDVLVLQKNMTLKDLKKDAVIGTDSNRRKSQLSLQRPDILIKSIRGNIKTRLKKLDLREYDGLILAAAGLIRLDLTYRITQYLPTSEFVPSPGQGALAVIIRKNDKNMFAILRKLNHNDTEIAIRAERAFSKKLGGGCTMPIGAYAEILGGKIRLHGYLGSYTKKRVRKASLTGNITDPEKLGEKLADSFLHMGYYISDNPKFVVVTRPEHISIEHQKQIESMGLLTYFYPSIAIAKSKLSKKSKTILSELKSFDWIFFTSRNGVRFFIEAIDSVGIPFEELKSKKIAVIGSKTAEVVKKYGLHVDFMPTRYTTEELGKQIQNIAKKKILLARANLSTPELTKTLRKKGAIVVDLHIYNTTFIENNTEEFENLLKLNQIFCFTFTSPSTVKGFITNITKSRVKNIVLNLPALSIGSVTTKTLQKYGFQNVYTADVFTTDGMIQKLQEIV